MRMAVYRASQINTIHRIVIHYERQGPEWGQGGAVSRVKARGRGQGHKWVMRSEIRSGGARLRRLIVKEQNQDVFFSSAGHRIGQEPGMGSGYHQRDVVLLS